jgi:hypothetical protein
MFTAQTAHGTWTEILFEGLRAGMPIFRHALLHGIDGDIRVKGDKSLVTWLDEEVEKVLRAVFAKYGYVEGEEFGGHGNTDARYQLFLDPVDGTRTLANRDMGTPCIIVGVYDRQYSRFVAAAIAHPGTGEVLVAELNHTKRYLWDGNDFTFLEVCRVWEYDPAITFPTVYIDNPNPFTRNGVPMLGAPGLNKLDEVIREAGLSKLVLASNGAAHTKLALGGPVVGTIMTSKGGIQDVPGMLLVENAGGTWMGVMIVQGEDGKRDVEPCDPHRIDLYAYDFLICAINPDWEAKLLEFLRQAVQL